MITNRNNFFNNHNPTQKNKALLYTVGNEPEQKSPVGKNIQKNSKMKKVLVRNLSERGPHPDLAFMQGDKYIGQLVDGEPNGHGKLTYRANTDDLVKYVGEFRDGMPHGKGTMKWKNKIYEGSWENGKRSGQGVTTYKNGEKEEGNYTNDQLNGEACITFGKGLKIKKGIFKFGELWDGTYEDKSQGRPVIESFKNGHPSETAILLHCSPACVIL